MPADTSRRGREHTGGREWLITLEGFPDVFFYVVHSLLASLLSFPPSDIPLLATFLLSTTPAHLYTPGLLAPTPHSSLPLGPLTSLFLPVPLHRPLGLCPSSVPHPPSLSWCLSPPTSLSLPLSLDLPFDSFSPFSLLENQASLCSCCGILCKGTVRVGRDVGISGGPVVLTCCLGKLTRFLS